MCITAVVSQAAVPVASAVGGAIAARAALNGKKSAGARPVIVAKVQDRRTPAPVLQTLDDDEYRTVQAPARLINHDRP